MPGGILKHYLIFLYLLSIELIWSDTFQKIVLDWISRKGLKKLDEPFASIEWPKISKIFWKIIDNPALLKLTKGKHVA